MSAHRYPKRPGRKTTTLKGVVIHLSPSQLDNLRLLANRKMTQPDQLAEEVVQNYLIDQRTNHDCNAIQRLQLESSMFHSSLDAEGHSVYVK